MAAYRMLHKLPEDLQETYKEIIIPEHMDSESLKIIKAADKISAYIKCIEEEKNGNQEFSFAKKSTEKAIHELNCEEAEIFIKDFIPAYYKTLDEL